ncbi:MAG: hypothetical protein QNJ47_07625 [Nostocaceae cyanobacterium]|nr:hypothetical protein [Nostocaceae cyanobacterium]
MNRNKMPLKFAIVLILFASLVGVPIRANAGGTIETVGEITDGSSGDMFAPPEGVVDFQVNPEGSIVNVSATVQNSLDRAGKKEDDQIDCRTSIVASYMAARCSNRSDGPTIRDGIVNLGAQEILVEPLIEEIFAVIKTDDMDINQLDRAITAYRTLILNSDKDVLERLKGDQDFGEIKLRLERLRNAL